jgi:hypothetical protein
MHITSLLLSPPSILSKTNSNLRILWDFAFQLNLDFISNSNPKDFRLLPHHYGPVWFQFFCTFSQKTQMSTQTACILSGVATTRVRGPREMHGAADSPKRNSAPVFPKNFVFLNPTPGAPILSPPPQSVLLCPLVRPPLVAMNPLAMSCNCLVVRRGFRMGCAPGDGVGGGGGTATWLSSVVEEKVDELLWREGNQSLLEGIEAAKRHGRRHRAAGGRRAPCSRGGPPTQEAARRQGRG